MTDPIQKIYDKYNLSTIGTYDQFKEAVSDPTVRRKVWSEHLAHVGTYEQFDEVINHGLAQSNIVASPNQAQPKQGDLGFQNNNPLNLRPVGRSKGFRTFDSLEEGYQAAERDLANKIAGRSPALNRHLRKHGKTYEQATLKDLIHTWAPPSENSAEVLRNYLDSVSKDLGVPENIHISQLNPRQLAIAMSRVESPDSYNDLMNHWKQYSLHQKQAEQAATQDYTGEINDIAFEKAKYKNEKKYDSLGWWERQVEDVRRRGMGLDSESIWGGIAGRDMTDPTSAEILEAKLEILKQPKYQHIAKDEKALNQVLYDSDSIIKDADKAADKAEGKLQKDFDRTTAFEKLLGFEYKTVDGKKVVDINPADDPYNNLGEAIGNKYKDIASERDKDYDKEMLVDVDEVMKLTEHPFVTKNPDLPTAVKRWYNSYLGKIQGDLSVPDRLRRDARRTVNYHYLDLAYDRINKITQELLAKYGSEENVDPNDPLTAEYLKESEIYNNKLKELDALPQQYKLIELYEYSKKKMQADYDKNLDEMNYARATVHKLNRFLDDLPSHIAEAMLDPFQFAGVGIDALAGTDIATTQMIREAYRPKDLKTSKEQNNAILNVAHLGNGMYAQYDGDKIIKFLDQKLNPLELEDDEFQRLTEYAKATNPDGGSIKMNWSAVWEGVREPIADLPALMGYGALFRAGAKGIAGWGTKTLTSSKAMRLTNAIGASADSARLTTFAGGFGGFVGKITKGAIEEGGLVNPGDILIAGGLKTSLEALIESINPIEGSVLTDAIFAGLTRSQVKQFAHRAGQEGVIRVLPDILKTVGKSMIDSGFGEALEEITASIVEPAILNPIINRLIDSNFSSHVSPLEVAEAALIGGLSGLAIGGGLSSISALGHQKPRVLNEAVRSSLQNENAFNTIFENLYTEQKKEIQNDSKLKEEEKTEKLKFAEEEYNRIKKVYTDARATAAKVFTKNENGFVPPSDFQTLYSELAFDAAVAKNRKAITEVEQEDLNDTITETENKLKDLDVFLTYGFNHYTTIDQVNSQLGRDNKLSKKQLDEHRETIYEELKESARRHSKKRLPDPTKLTLVENDVKAAISAIKNEKTAAEVTEEKKKAEAAAKEEEKKIKENAKKAVIDTAIKSGKPIEELSASGITKNEYNKRVTELQDQLKNELKNYDIEIQDDVEHFLSNWKNVPGAVDIINSFAKRKLSENLVKEETDAHDRGHALDMEAIQAGDMTSYANRYNTRPNLEKADEQAIDRLFMDTLKAHGYNEATDTSHTKAKDMLAAIAKEKGSLQAKLGYTHKFQTPDGKGAMLNYSDVARDYFASAKKTTNPTTVIRGATSIAATSDTKSTDFAVGEMVHKKGNPERVGTVVKINLKTVEVGYPEANGTTTKKYEHPENLVKVTPVDPVVPNPTPKVDVESDSNLPNSGVETIEVTDRPVEEDPTNNNQDLLEELEALEDDESSDQSTIPEGGEVIKLRNNHYISLNRREGKLYYNIEFFDDEGKSLGFEEIQVEEVNHAKRHTYNIIGKYKPHATYFMKRPFKIPGYNENFIVTTSIGENNKVVNHLVDNDILVHLSGQDLTDAPIYFELDRKTTYNEKNIAKGSVNVPVFGYIKKGKLVKADQGGTKIYLGVLPSENNIKSMMLETGEDYVVWEGKMDKIATEINGHWGKMRPLTKEEILKNDLAVVEAPVQRNIETKIVNGKEIVTNAIWRTYDPTVKSKTKVIPSTRPTYANEMGNLVLLVNGKAIQLRTKKLNEVPRLLQRMSGYLDELANATTTDELKNITAKIVGIDKLGSYPLVKWRDGHGTYDVDIKEGKAKRGGIQPFIYYHKGQYSYSYVKGSDVPVSGGKQWMSKEEILKDLGERRINISAHNLKDEAFIDDIMIDALETDVQEVNGNYVMAPTPYVKNDIVDKDVKLKLPKRTIIQDTPVAKLTKTVSRKKGKQFKPTTREDNNFHQIKNIFNSALELENKLKSINKTINGIGSNSNLNSVLKRANIEPKLREQFIQLVNENPELRSLKISDVISMYLKEFVKESDKQYYTAVAEPLSEKLDEILIKYFDKFHIRREELDNLKEKFGVDSIGVFDVLAKTVYYSKNRNLLTLPEEYGHVFVELLGSVGNKRSDNPLFKYLFDNIKDWDGYNRVFEQYKDLYVTNEGNVDIYKIKKEAIGQAIGIALVRNFKVNEGDKGFWSKVQELIDYVLNLIQGIDYVSLNTTVDSVAKDILNNNYSKLDRLNKNTSNYNLLSYSETIENQNKKDGGLALSFMKWFSEKGSIITGSLAYRLQGTTYRPEIDALHDIDMIVPSDIHKINLDKSVYLSAEQLENDKLYRKYMLENNYREAKKYKVQANLKLDMEDVLKNEYFREIQEKYPDLDFLYTFYNQKANSYYITINAIWSKDQSLKDKFKSHSGSFNKRLENFTEEELSQIYLFDFFLRPEPSSEYVQIEDKEYGLNLAHFNYSFYEKLNTMGRPKDAYDYQMWDYFDDTDILAPDFNDRLVYFQAEMSAEKDRHFSTIDVVKEGVFQVFESNPELYSIGTQEQYSDYLNTIFPNSQVKDIVYHGTEQPGFKEFDINAKSNRSLVGKLTSTKGIFFTDNIEGAKVYAGIDEELGIKRGDIYSVLIDIKNPNTSPKNIDHLTIDEQKGYDSAIDKGQYVVFDPKQIHILGSKSDIDGFKQYVNSGQEELNQELKEKESEALQYIKDRFEEVQAEVNDDHINKLYEILGWSRGNKKIYGVFQDAMAILSSDSELVVGRHESIHVVMGLFLSPQQRAQVYAEARRKWGNLIEYDLEEKIADLFEDYKLNLDLFDLDKVKFPKLAQFINDLYNFIFKQFSIAQSYITGDMTISRLFYGVEANVLGRDFWGNRKASVNDIFKRNLEILTSGPKFRVKEWSASQHNRYARLITVDVFDHYLENRYYDTNLNRIVETTNADLQEIISDFTGDALSSHILDYKNALLEEGTTLDESTYDQIVEALSDPDFKLVIQSSFNANRYISIKKTLSDNIFEEDVLEEEILEDTGDNEGEQDITEYGDATLSEDYLVENRSINPINRASARLKEFLSLVPKYIVSEDGSTNVSTYEDTGQMVYYNLHNLFNRMVLDISDSTSGYDMFNKLNKLSEDHIWGKYILQEVIGDSEYDQRLEKTGAGYLVADDLSNLDTLPGGWILRDIWTAIGSQTNESPIFAGLKRDGTPFEFNLRSAEGVEHYFYNRVGYAFDEILKDSNSVEQIEEIIKQLTPLLDDIKDNTNAVSAIMEFMDILNFPITLDIAKAMNRSSGKNGIANNRLEIIKAFEEIINNYNIAIRDINDSTRPSILSDAFRTIVKIIDNYNTDIGLLSYDDINGKKRYAHVPSNYLTREFNKFKQDPAAWVKSKTQYMLDETRSLPILFHADIPLYKDMLRDPVQHSLVEDGYIKHEFAAKGKEYREYSKKDVLLANLIAFYGNPSKFSQTFTFGAFSDSPQRRFLKAPLYKHELAIDKMIDLLAAEATRVEEIKKRKNDPLKYHNIMESGTMYHTIGIMNKIVKDNSLSDDWYKHPVQVKVVREALSEHMWDNFNNKYIKALRQYGLLDEKEGKDGNFHYVRSEAGKRFNLPNTMNFSRTGSTYAYYLNQYYYSAATQVVFDGDPAFYGPNSATDRRATISVPKRAKQKVSPSIPALSPETTLNILVFKDIVKPSINKAIERMISAYNFVVDTTLSKEENDIINNQVRDKIRKNLSKNDVADAAGYHNLYRRERLMRDNNLWNEAKHPAMFKRLREGNPTEEDLQETFQPIKPFVYGLVHDIVKDPVNGDLAVLLPFQIKDSEVLLLPQLAYQVERRNLEGDKTFEVRIPKSEKELLDNIDSGAYEHPQLARMLYYMDNTLDGAGRPIGLGVFESAIKAAKFNVLDLNNLNSDTATENRISISLDMTGDQMSVPEKHVDRKIAEGTQPPKILTGDLAHEFRDIRTQLDEIDKLNILDELKKVSEKTKDFKSLQAFLVDKLLEKVDSFQLIDSLKLYFNEAIGKEVFSKPLPLMGSSIEKMINSLYKNAGKPKARGGALVNMASVGLDSNLKLVMKKVIENGKEVEVIDYYEAAVSPFSTEFYNLVDENGYLSVDHPVFKKNPELLRAVLYRIPTEGKYSIIPIKITKFLPVGTGGAIILPPEITSISGLDFDIDKLFGFFREFVVNKTNDYISNFRKLINKQLKTSYNNEAIREIIEGVEDIDSLDEYEGDHKNEVKLILENRERFSKKYANKDYNQIQIIKSSLKNKRSRANLKLDLYEKAISTSNFTRDLLMGGSKARLEAYRDALPSKDTNLYEDINEPTKAAEIAFNNIIGKRLVGIFANANSLANMVKDVVELYLKEPVVINGTTYGTIFPSEARNGESILRNIAEVLFASTEDVKNPVLGPLNINDTTSGVFILLLSMGVPFNEALDYINDDLFLDITNKAESSGVNLLKALKAYPKGIQAYYAPLFIMSNEFTDLTLTLKIDTRKIGPELADVEAAIFKINNLANNEDTNIANLRDIVPVVHRKDVDDLNSDLIMVSESGIGRINNYLQILLNEINENKKFFSHFDPKFIGIKRLLDHALKPGYYFRPDQVKTINHAIYDYQIQRVLGAERIFDLLENFPDRFFTAKLDEKYKKLIDAFEPFYNENVHTTIISKRPYIGAITEDTNEIMGLFEQLIEENPEIGIDLATYSIILGTNFSLRGYSHLIPPSYYTKTKDGRTVSDAIYNTDAVLHDKALQNVLSKQIIMNNYKKITRRFAKDDFDISGKFLNHKELKTGVAPQYAYIRDKNSDGKTISHLLKLVEGEATSPAIYTIQDTGFSDGVTKLYLPPNHELINKIKAKQLERAKKFNEEKEAKRLEAELNRQQEYDPYEGETLEALLEASAIPNTGFTMPEGIWAEDEVTTAPPQSTSQPTQLSSQQDISTFTNHSGGAVGSDIQWDIIGKEYGMVNNKHYYFEGFKTPNGNTSIPINLKNEADEKLKAANKTLGRKFPTAQEYINNLLRRNWWQVKNSDAIFAISSIKDNKVLGGTGWAVHMAIAENKPVYVFDQTANKWYTWNNDQFVETGTPVLTKNFAGIGTREINKEGIQAIRDVYENTINNTSQAPTQQSVNPTVDTTGSWDALKNNLEDKTQSANILLPIDFKKSDKDIFGALPEFKKQYPTGIIAYRMSKSKSLLQSYRENNAIGNPFNWQKHGVQIATDMFAEWLLTGKNFNESTAKEEYRQAIIQDINNNKLVGQKILYYTEVGRPTHATVLDYLINNWNNITQQTTSTPKSSKRMNAPKSPIRIIKGALVIPLTSDFTRDSVKQDEDYLYVFTDNAGRKSGSNKVDDNSWYAKLYGKGKTYPTLSQAIIRGLTNAFPITTMVNDRKLQWKDSQFDQYKQIIDQEIQQIVDAINSGSFKGIKFSTKKPFGMGMFSRMKDSAPKIYKYMTEKLMEIGIDNRGKTPVPLLTIKQEGLDQIMQAQTIDALTELFNELSDAKKKLYKPYFTQRKAEINNPEIDMTNTSEIDKKIADEQKSTEIKQEPCKIPPKSPWAEDN